MTRVNRWFTNDINDQLLDIISDVKSLDVDGKTSSYTVSEVWYDRWWLDTFHCCYVTLYQSHHIHQHSRTRTQQTRHCILVTEIHIHISGICDVCEPSRHKIWAAPKRVHLGLLQHKRLWCANLGWNTRNSCLVAAASQIETSTHLVTQRREQERVPVTNWGDILTWQVNWRK